MSVDLEGLSVKQLADLIARAKQRRKMLMKRKPAAQVRAQIRAAAARAGYTVPELLGDKVGNGRSATGPRRGGKPKYRNPANRTEAWSGRGKRPRWLVQELAKGRLLADFAN